MNSARLQQQIRFIVEIDKLKTVLRRSYLVGKTRRENSAEHSWHLSVMALVLAEHANQPVDTLRVLKMLIVHDIVEIDADDTFVYDDVNLATKAERETRAAERIFGLLPDDQTQEIAALWQEFEQRVTPEARFANALDRFMPLLHNYHTQGGSWQEHGIVSSQVRARNGLMAEGSQDLWDYASALIDDAIAQGYLAA